MKYLILLLLLSLTAPTAGKKSALTNNVVAPLREKQKKRRKLTSLDLAVCGAVATMIGDASMHPIDCIKTLQQSDAGTGLSMFGAGKQIFKNNGVIGFYSGMGTYVTSDGLAGALKFATYEALKTWIQDKIPEDYQGAALFGCAAVSFMASSIILVPGELLKQRLQMGQITSVSSGIRQIWTQDGILGFFAGYSGVCFRDIPYTMMELGIYDNLKSLYFTYKNRNNEEGDEVQKITQVDEIIAAAITGAITGYFTVPFDTIKTKLMVDSAAYSGFRDAFQKTLAAGGVSALFQGGAARISWLMPFTAIYLPVYEVFKRKLSEMFVPADDVLTASSGNEKNPLAVKGGAQMMTHRTRNVCGWGRTSCGRGQPKHFLDRTDSFVSF